MTAFIFVCSLPVLVLLGLLSQFLPQDLPLNTPHFFIKHRQSLTPEYELPIYRSIILLNLAGIAVGGWLLSRLNDWEKAIVWLGRRAAVQAVWSVLAIGAVFKNAVFNPPAWGHSLVWAILGFNVLFWVFYPEIKRAGSLARVIMTPARVLVMVSVFLSLCVLIPEPAKTPLIVGQASPFDAVQAWLAGGMRRFAHLDLRHGIMSMSAMAVAYIFGLIMLWRLLLRDDLLTAVTAVVFVKLHFFHDGALPVIWLNPKISFLPVFLDVLLFYAFWKHLSTGRALFIWFAAAITSASFLWDSDGGMKLYAIYMVYLGVMAWQKMFQQAHGSGRLGILVLFPTLFIFVAGAWGGQNLLNDFWMRFLGTGAKPFFECLKTRHFFAYIMGFIVPVIYTASLLAVMPWSRQLSSTNTPSLKERVSLVWIALMSVYGLLVFSDYVIDSRLSFYYQGAFPLMTVVAWWANCLLGRLSMARKHILWFALGLALLGLMTNRLFGIYPHVFNSIL